MKRERKCLTYLLEDGSCETVHGDALKEIEDAEEEEKKENGGAEIRWFRVILGGSIGKSTEDSGINIENGESVIMGTEYECDGCGLHGNSVVGPHLLRCKKCYMAWYCSEACREKCHKTHDKTCGDCFWIEDCEEPEPDSMEESDEEINFRPKKKRKLSDTNCNTVANTEATLE